MESACETIEQLFDALDRLNDERKVWAEKTEGLYGWWYRQKLKAAEAVETQIWETIDQLKIVASLEVQADYELRNQKPTIH